MFKRPATSLICNEPAAIVVDAKRMKEDFVISDALVQAAEVALQPFVDAQPVLTVLPEVNLLHSLLQWKTEFQQNRPSYVSSPSFDDAPFIVGIHLKLSASGTYSSELCMQLMMSTTLNSETMFGIYNDALKQLSRHHDELIRIATETCPRITRLLLYPIFTYEYDNTQNEALTAMMDLPRFAPSEHVITIYLPGINTIGLGKSFFAVGKSRFAVKFVHNDKFIGVLDAEFSPDTTLGNIRDLATKHLHSTTAHSDLTILDFWIKDPETGCKKSCYFNHGKESQPLSQFLWRSSDDTRNMVLELFVHVVLNTDLLKYVLKFSITRWMKTNGVLLANFRSKVIVHVTCKSKFPEVIDCVMISPMIVSTYSRDDQLAIYSKSLNVFRKDAPAMLQMVRSIGYRSIGFNTLFSITPEQMASNKVEPEDCALPCKFSPNGAAPYLDSFIKLFYQTNQTTTNSPRGHMVYLFGECVLSLHVKHCGAQNACVHVSRKLLVNGKTKICEVVKMMQLVLTFPASIQMLCVCDYDKKAVRTFKPDDLTPISNVIFYGDILLHVILNSAA